MEEKRLIAEWLLEYACYNHMTSVLHVSSKRYMKNESEETSKNLSAEILSSKSGAIPARYMLATLKTIAMRDRDCDYETALQILDQLFASATSHIPFKLFSKCETGLKILTLFHHLRVRSKRAIPLLNQYFPTEGCLHPETPKHSRTKMTESQKGFRTFFLPLATNDHEGQKYIDESFEKDFGSAFAKVLKKHIGDFVSLIEKLLPRPVLLKFVDEPEFLKKLKCLNSPSLTTFVDGLEGKPGLAEPEVLAFLASVLHEPSGYRRLGRTSHSPEIILSHTSGKELAQDKVQNLGSASGEQSPTAISLQEDGQITEITPTTLTIIPLQTPTKRIGSSASLSGSPNKKLYITTCTEAKLSTPDLPVTVVSPEQHSAKKTGMTSDEDVLSPSPQYLRTGTKLMNISRLNVLSLRENTSPEKMQPNKTGHAKFSTNMVSPNKYLDIDRKTMDSPTRGRTSPDVDSRTRGRTSPDVDSPTRGRTSPDVDSPTRGRTSPDVDSPTRGRTSPDVDSPTRGRTSPDVDSPTRGRTSPDVSPRKEGSKQAESFAERLSTFRIKMASPRKTPTSPKKSVVSDANEVEHCIMPVNVQQRSSNAQFPKSVSPEAIPDNRNITADNKRESPRKVWSSPRTEHSSPSKTDEVLSVAPSIPLKTSSHRTTVGDISPQTQQSSLSKGYDGPSKRVSWSDEVIEISSPELESPSKVLSSLPKQRTSPRKEIEITNQEPIGPGKTRSSLGKTMARKQNVIDRPPIPSTRLASTIKVLASPSKRLPSPSKVLASPNSSKETNRLETHGHQSHSPLKSSGELFVTSEESNRSRELSSPDKYPASPRKRYRQDDRAHTTSDISPADKMESPRKRQKRYDTQSFKANTFGSPDISSSNEGVSSPTGVLKSSACSARAGGQESDDEWHSCVEEVDNNNADIDIDGKATKPKDEFIQWCENALREIKSSVDVPTFIEFLQDVESPDEVHDYVRTYLGEGKEAKEFATQFLERRSRFKNHLKQDQAEYNTPCSTAVPDIQSSHYSEVIKKCTIKLYAADYEGVKEQIYM